MKWDTHVFICCQAVSKNLCLEDASSLPAAEAKKAVDASLDMLRIPRPPDHIRRLACIHWSSVREIIIIIVVIIIIIIIIIIILLFTSVVKIPMAKGLSKKNVRSG